MCYKHDLNELHWERQADAYWDQRLVPPEENEEWVDDSVLIDGFVPGGIENVES